MYLVTRPHLGWEDVLYDGVFAALLTLPVTRTLLYQPATQTSIYFYLFIYMLHLISTLIYLTVSVHHYLSSPLWLAVVHEAEAAAVGQLHLGQELLRAHRGHCHGEAEGKCLKM